MFGNELFRSWPVVLTCAACFGTLFGLILLLSDTLFFGLSGVSSAAIGITWLSFAGYVLVALLIRREDVSS